MNRRLKVIAEWRAKNPDKVKAYAATYRERNRAKRAAYNKKYRLANRARCRETQRRWREKNRERYLEQRRWVGLFAKYGLTKSDFERMLKRQGNRCAVCRRPWKKVNRKRSFEVDHNHRTGRVRGLLCTPCNTGIGHLRENIEVMTNAIKYLKRTA